jgi:hypothetical protein
MEVAWRRTLGWTKAADPSKSAQADDEDDI